MTFTAPFIAPSAHEALSASPAIPAAAPGALVDRLNAVLPQTQCTRCGYPDCRAYAEAITSGQAAINRCPPGGAEGIQRLAHLTGLPVLALDLSCGPEVPRLLAVIDEAWCIGCTLCLKVCPVDSITGANKLMHTVIDDLCTGCELCVPACPVDCIALVPVTPGRTGWQAWSAAQADEAQQRYAFHQLRQARDLLENDDRLASRAATKLADLPAHTQHTDPAVLDHKRAVIAAALARARARKATIKTDGSPADPRP